MQNAEDSLQNNSEESQEYCNKAEYSQYILEYSKVQYSHKEK